MPITNKPQYGDALIEVDDDGEGIAWMPFQEFLDALVDQVDASEEVGASNAERIGRLELQTFNVLIAADFTDQNPPGLDSPIQITLGPPQENEFVSLAADGTVTFNAHGLYTFRLRLLTGREGNPGEARLFTRFVAAGVQLGASVETILDDAKIRIPNTFSADLYVPAGFAVAFEFFRDSDGVNEGGLRTGTPTTLAWNPSPSAQLVLDRFDIEVAEPEAAIVRFT